MAYKFVNRTKMLESNKSIKIKSMCLLWIVYQFEASFIAEKVVNANVALARDPAINSER